VLATSAIPEVILNSFGSGLQKLIEEAVGQKLQFLENKEKELQEREEKVRHVLENIELRRQGQVTLRVGERLFYTTADVLLSRKDSYFHGLLNPEFEKTKTSDGIYFIPRDGDVFAYVLEYLTYGELLQPIAESSQLVKLVADADFYLLSGLKAQAQEQLKNLESKASGLHKTGTVPYAKLEGTGLGGSGQYWQWNIKSLNNDFFSLSTGTYNNDTLTIKQAGTYSLSSRATVNISSNYQLSLYLNGAEVARVYSYGNGYQTLHINDVFAFKAGDRIQISQTYNSSPLNGALYNQLSVVYLSE
jgi:hypothetical protein